MGREKAVSNEEFNTLFAHNIYDLARARCSFKSGCYLEGVEVVSGPTSEEPEGLACIPTSTCNNACGLDDAGFEEVCYEAGNNTLIDLGLIADIELLQ